MSFSLIMLVLLVVFLYQMAQQLWTFEGGFAAFGTAQWLMFALCILFVPLIVLSAIRYIKDNKKRKAEQEEEAKKQQAELSQRRRSKYLMDEEGFDESYSELDKPAKPEDDEDLSDGEEPADPEGDGESSEESDGEASPSKERAASKYDE